MTEGTFVDVVTHGQAAAPMYFAYAANSNRQTRATLDEHDETVALDLAAVLDAWPNLHPTLDEQDS